MNTARTRLMIGLLSLVLAACAAAQGDPGNAAARLAAKPIDNAPYGGEEQDWNVTATDQLKIEPYHYPTPLTHPGAKVIRTFALREMLLSPAEPVVMNVLGTGGKADQTDGIPESVWLAGAGVADLDEGERRRFAEALQTLTGGDSAKPLVFYCLDARCWLSYNAALRARQLGYTDVYWYRGGIYSWWQAGLPIIKQAVAYNFL
jgi:PQQ-dependent catabolism-associated CXXCW motif protein